MGHHDVVEAISSPAGVPEQLRFSPDGKYLLLRAVPNHRLDAEPRCAVEYKLACLSGNPNGHEGPSKTPLEN